MSAKRNKAWATCNEVACHPRTVVASDQPLMRPFSPSAERFDTSREEVCKRSGTSNECLTACQTSRRLSLLSSGRSNTRIEVLIVRA